MGKKKSKAKPAEPEELDEFKEDKEVEEDKKPEAKTEKDAFYAVFDPNGKYIRAYADKKIAEEFTAKPTNKGKDIKKITAKEKEEFDAEKAEELAKFEAEKDKLHKEGHLPITIH